MSKRGKRRTTELQKIRDPNFVLKVAIGPPLASLVPQAPGSGLTLGGQFCQEKTRFIWRKAHVTADNNRIFDATGRLMAVSYQYGKNPYESLDPLGIAFQSNETGESDSVCYIGGYNGMPDLKMRPKTISLHGRQYIRDASGEITFCNVSRQSRLQSMSIRQNFAVYAGEEEKRPVYRILVDKAGRTMQVMNDQDERVAILEKSVKTLLLNVSLGVGLEFIIDVAPGVDWTAILAIVIGLHQVVKDIFIDEFNNFLGQSLEDAVTGYAEDEAEQAIEGDDGGNDDGDGGGDADGGGDYGGDGGGDADADADEEGGGDADADEGGGGDADPDEGGGGGADADADEEDGGGADADEDCGDADADEEDSIGGRIISLIGEFFQ